MCCSVDGARKIGESVRLRDGEPHQPHPFVLKSRVQQENPDADEALLDGCSAWHRTSGLRHFGCYVAQHDRREQLSLVAKAGIDRLLSRAGGLGNLVDACAFEAAFEKELAGRVEHTLTDLASEFLGRAAKAHRGPPGWTPLRRRRLVCGFLEC